MPYQNKPIKSPVRRVIPPLNVVIAALFTHGCCFGGANKPNDSALTIVGGEAQKDVLLNPDTVEAYRLNGAARRENEKRVAGPVPLDAEQTSRLTRLLLDDDSYEWDYAKACLPTPGVLIVFENATGRSEVRLCYECNIVQFEPGRGEDFDPVAAELIDWAQDVFPEDEAIQALEP